jgi:hypothetical protein
VKEDATPAELLSIIRDLKDRQEILDCIYRESRGRDRHDAAITAGCYWDDGEVDNGKSVTPALAWPAAANAGHAAGFAATTHSIANHLCDIDGDVAYTESYCIGSLLSKDISTCKVVSSRLVDRFERRNGEWRIKHRRVVIETAAEGDASWLTSDTLRNFWRGDTSKDDPSYERSAVADPRYRRW